MTEFLQKLLNGQKVEWRKLGDCDFFEIANSGRKPVKADLRISGNIPYYGANNIQDYVEGFTHDGEFVLIAEDGSASLENYSIQYVNGKFWANNHVHVVRGTDKVNTRYLYHYLRIVNFIPFLSSMERAKLTKGKMIKLPIPLPPLPVQKEIVQILDTLTTHTAELKTRKKQYNHYREKLLTFEAGVESKKLGEVVDTVTAPTKLNKEFYYEFGKIPIIDQGIEFIAGYTNEDLKALEMGEYIIFGDHSEHIKYVDFAFIQGADGLKILKPIEDNAKYIYYAFENFYQKELNYKRHWSRAKETPIPIPPLSVQKEIVQILDKFDALTSSAKEGLQKEIELRTKQYEYYRNQLLNFKNDLCKTYF